MSTSAIYKSEEGQRLVESRYRDLLTRWPVPPDERSISTSFGDTFVVACGSPSMPPVVLLQGSGANAAMWLSDVATLSASHRYCLTHLVRAKMRDLNVVASAFKSKRVAVVSRSADDQPLFFATSPATAP